MTRGIAAQDGDTRISQNGYHYTKTPQGWVLTHRLLAEAELGRVLLETERVGFRNKDRNDLRPENIYVFETRAPAYSKEKKRAYLQAKLEDIQAQLDDLDESL